jgi:hypothetical protein
MKTLLQRRFPEVGDWVFTCDDIGVITDLGLEELTYWNGVNLIRIGLKEVEEYL